MELNRCSSDGQLIENGKVKGLEITTTYPKRPVNIESRGWTGIWESLHIAVD